MTESFRYCGSRETMGHGESATCGEPYYGPLIWQCRSCAVKEAARLRGVLEEVRQYLAAAADGSMSRNNSEALAEELLQQLDA